MVRVVEPVHASQLYLAPIATGTDSYGESMAARVAPAEDYIQNVTMRLRLENRGLDIEGEVRVADSPGAAIVEIAETHGADLVVLAAHRRGVSHLAGRSVADRVLRGGPRATLLVRGEND